jgi:hypothetical protein
MRKIDDKELGFIADALRIAAEQYQKDAAALRADDEAASAAARHAMAAQFEQKQREAWRLAEFYGNYPPAAVATCEKCANAEGPHECKDKLLLRLLGEE